MDAITYINGVRDQKIDVTDRGYQYGDGLFETMLVCNSSIPLWNSHIQRLRLGCQRLHIAVPDTDSIWRLVKDHITGTEHKIIKIIVTRGTSERGYRVTTTKIPNVVISITGRQFKPVCYWRDGVSVYPCKTQLAEQPALAGIKHLNRLEQILASSEWDDHFQEGIMCDARGEAIEATSHNLFAVNDGILLTPDLIAAGVAGVMRQYVIDLASSHGWPVHIQPIQYTELLNMNEIFLTNSIDGIWPVRQLGDQWLPVGDVTRKLQADVAALLPYK